MAIFNSYVKLPEGSLPVPQIFWKSFSVSQGHPVTDLYGTTLGESSQF